MPWKQIEHSVQAIADFLGAPILWNAPGKNASDRLVRTIAPLEEAQVNAVSFCRNLPTDQIASGRFECGAMLCSDAVAAKLSHLTPCIVVENPIRALVKVMPMFFDPDQQKAGIHPTAVVDQTAKIAATASVGALAVIGAGAVVGEFSVIHPQACLYPRVRVGVGVIIHSQVVVREDTELADGVILQPGAIIGADGFGFLPDPPRGPVTVPQIGSVVLGEGVEVGANSCVDRATLSKTVVGKGTKIDNLVQIGHNVQVGEHCILCGQVALGGSSKIGRGVVMGGKSAVADHTTVVDHVRIAAKSGVIQDIHEPGDYAGFPSMPAKDWLRAVASLRQLPDRLRKLAAKTNDQG